MSTGYALDQSDLCLVNRLPSAQVFGGIRQTGGGVFSLWERKGGESDSRFLLYAPVSTTGTHGLCHTNVLVVGSLGKQGN